MQRSNVSVRLRFAEFAPRAPTALCAYIVYAFFCTAWLLAQGSTATGQVISQKPEAVSVDCQATHKRAVQLVQEYDAKLQSAERKVAEAVVETAVRNGLSRAEGYNEYGGGAVMQAQFPSAAWGALKAASLEWNPIHVSNVGIYLTYLNRLDDAGVFLQCAGTMAPQSPFVIEGRAMLAHGLGDHKTATQLIEQAVRIMPGDLNVQYTAGVIFYKAGDRARAKQFLQEALRMAPNYKTVVEALKVVDPSGQSSPPAQQDALRKLVAECFRYMDEMLAIGETAGRYREEMKAVQGASNERTPAGGSDYADMRRNVEQSKAAITNLETRARDPRNSAKAVGWNATIQECILAYLKTTADLEQILNDQGVDIVIALSMRMKPLRLIEKLKLHNEGTNPFRYVIQDEKFKYFQIEDPARKALSAGYKACEGRADDEACRRPYVEAYCATAIPVWIGHRNNVLVNMRAAEAGYRDAAKDWAGHWNRLARGAADYSKRALAAMKPVTTADLKNIPAATRQTIISVSSPDAHSRQTRAAYTTYIGSMTSMVTLTLTQSNDAIVDALDTAPEAFLHSAFYTDECLQKPSEKVSLDAEMEKLLAALIEASEFDATIQPECDFEFGGWKTSIKPLSPDNDLNLEHSNVKVSGDAENDRWGVEYTATSMDHNVGVFTGEVSVKLWGEGRGGTADYGAQVEGKVGVGQKTPIGGIACYFGTASYKFNARAFAGALTR